METTTRPDQPTKRALYVREDGGPVCALCGKLPSTPDLEQQAIDWGSSPELDAYVVNITYDRGPMAGTSAVLVSWVCAGHVHGNVNDSAEEGRRIGRFRG